MTIPFARSSGRLLSIDDLDRFSTLNGSQILRQLRRRLGFHEHEHELEHKRGHDHEPPRLR